MTGQIDLEPLDQFGQGVFQISTDLLQNDKVTQRLDRATVVITDIAAIAKQDGDDLFVWTRSAADMRAKRGVHVRAMTYSNIEGKLFSPAGDEIRRDTQVTVSLHRVLVNWNYLWDPEERYARWRPEEVLLPEGGLVTIEVRDGRFQTLLPTQSTYGAYVVRARLTDKEAVADLKVSLEYAWYWQAAGEADTPKPPSPDRIKLLLSHNEVEAGKTVKVRFDAPVNGHMLLAVESDRLLTHRWGEVRKGPQEFDIVAPDVLPNVYVSVVVLKDPMEGVFYVPARAWGSVALTLVPRAYMMRIDVDVPQEMRPQQELAITLRAHPGEKTQFTVAVVDEGILQLTDFKTPDPLAYFFAPRRLGVRTFETVGWTFARALQPVKDPGGGMEKRGKKAGVIPVTIVSYWSGIVDSDYERLTIERR
ncbi:MAG: hypothetical protein HYZ81_08810 [Nitrospinae bacterium]|nr:hypothetical protein [Nitrospinota bacterium]